MVVDDASSSIHIVFVVRRARRARTPELRTRRRKKKKGARFDFRAPPNAAAFGSLPSSPRRGPRVGTRRGAMQDAERPRSLLRREIERLGDDRRYGTSTSALSSTTSGSFEDAHHRRSYGLRASPPSAATLRRDVDDPDRYRHLYGTGTTSRVPRRSESALDPSPYASGRDRDREGDTVPPSSSFPRRARVGAAPSYDAETRRYVGTVGQVTGVRTSASAATVERRVSSTSRAARASVDEDIRRAPSSSRASLDDAGARYVRSGAWARGARPSTLSRSADARVWRWRRATRARARTTLPRPRTRRSAAGTKNASRESARRWTRTRRRDASRCSTARAVCAGS